MAKDMQRSKIERVEARLSAPVLTPLRVQQMVHDTLRSRWWGTRRPDVRAMTVQYGWRECTVHPSAARITQAQNPTYLTVMHALAHFLQPEGTVVHGPEFALAYLHLVTRFIGQSQGTTLRAAFRFEKIKTSTWSPEARAAASERSLQKRFTDAGDRARQLLAELEEEDE